MNTVKIVMMIDGRPQRVTMQCPDRQLNTIEGRPLSGYTFHATCGFSHILTVMYNGEAIGFVGIEKE
jgi:hypothetical protein